jgi:hypothetical protein
MLKADIGDILYIVIFAVLMLAGGLEKYVKAKRQQQQDRTPRPPQSRDEYVDEEEERSAPRQAPPQTLEEMLKRMLQPADTREREDTYPEEAQSLEVIQETPARKDYYQPVVSQVSMVMNQSEKEAFAVPTLEEEKGTPGLNEYEFDLRQAIISNEILNRKY